MAIIARAITGLGLALALSPGAMAETLRVPGTGEPALIVDVPSDWTLIRVDDDNGFARSPDYATILQIGMIRGNVAAETSLSRLAQAVLREAGAKPYTRSQPGKVVDRSGQTFYSDVTNQSGIHMAFVLDIAKVDARNAATVVTLTMDKADAQQKRHLAELKKKIRLVGAK